MAKTKLHEILAVDADRAKTAQAIAEEAKVSFGKKPHLFSGHVKDTRFFSEERQNENLTDKSALSETVPGKLDYVAKIVGNHYDTYLTKEVANTTAFAHVEIDGVVLVEKAPASWLLGMESRLRSLRDVYAAIPTLDPGAVWNPDAGAGEHVYRAEPVKNLKTENVAEYITVAPATKEHPAQIAKETKNPAVAEIVTTRYSGMVTPARKSELLGRLDRLISAVKQARQRANSVEIEQHKVAKGLFDWLHAE